MEGCLSTLVKLLILAGLFIAGLFIGYFYYQGIFDGPLVEYSFRRVEKLSPEDALRRVDATLTVEQAAKNLSRVDRRWVLWTGLYSDTRVLSQTLNALTVRTTGESKRVFVAFCDQSMANTGIHVGDTIEVLGIVRRLWVASEDREGRQYPQVLAIRVRKVTPVPEASTGTEPATRVTKEIKDSHP